MRRCSMCAGTTSALRSGITSSSSTALITLVAGPGSLSSSSSLTLRGCVVLRGRRRLRIDARRIVVDGKRACARREIVDVAGYAETWSIAIPARARRCRDRTHTDLSRALGPARPWLLRVEDDDVIVL